MTRDLAIACAKYIVKYKRKPCFIYAVFNYWSFTEHDLPTVQAVYPNPVREYQEVVLMAKDKKYFVWIEGMRGPEAQKWDGEQTVNQKPVPTLAKHEISDTEWTYGIELLKGLYPYEAKS